MLTWSFIFHYRPCWIFSLSSLRVLKLQMSTDFASCKVSWTTCTNDLPDWDELSADSIAAHLVYTRIPANEAIDFNSLYHTSVPSENFYAMESFLPCWMPFQLHWDENEMDIAFYQDCCLLTCLCTWRDILHLVLWRSILVVVNLCFYSAMKLDPLDIVHYLI